MAGQALSLFGEFVNETGDAYFSGKDERINDAQKTNYRTLGYLARGQKMSDMIQGGRSIRDIIYLSTQSTGVVYYPNEPISRVNKQTGTPWEVPWRFWENHIGYTDQETELNEGASAEQYAQQFKRIWNGKKQDLATDQANFMEELLWRPPNTTEMEDPLGKYPMSIPAGINENANGLYGAAAPGGAWTTFQRINPVTYPNWVPYQKTYTATSGIVQTLISAFDDAWMTLGFQPPPFDKQYFESEMAEPINIVCTSKIGVLNLMNVYRSNNDRWTDQRDPWFQPMYAGSPIVYVAQLDTAPIFPTGAAGALSTEFDTAGTANAGPRYFLIQPKYLRMVFKKFMEDKGEFTDPATIESHFRPVVTWGNLVFRSRRRHGILYPGADITNPLPSA